jgi:hypothetical protein
VKERPILFSGEMVRAILDNRKTMTRRVIKDVPGITTDVLKSSISWEWKFAFCPIPSVASVLSEWIKCPYGFPGDRLWVRENLRHHSTGTPTRYAADGCPVMRDGESIDWIFNESHVPSIHMPRWASRITLEITGVRAERVQDISEEDAISEGVDCVVHSGIRTNTSTHVDQFFTLWDSINSKRGYSWASNPWVWVVEFKRVTP